MKKFFLTAIAILASIGVFNTASAQTDIENMRTKFSGLSSAPLVEIDAPRKNAWGRQFEVAPSHHVNGMARIEEWYIVNYGNKDGKQGRVFFWKEGADDYEMPLWYDTDGGKPEHMDSAGDYLAVATTGGRFIKFFDFSNPSSGVSEITGARLSNKSGHLGFTYNPTKQRYYVLTYNDSTRQNVIYESNASTLEQTTNWTLVRRFALPNSEGGKPIVRFDNNQYAIVMLGAGQGTAKEPYGYRLTHLKFSAGSNSTTVSIEKDETNYMLDEGSAGGAPSFRWGGTVVKEDEKLAFYAAPKRLDASGNYYKWSAQLGTSGAFRVKVVSVRTIETTEAGEDEIYLEFTGGTRVPAGRQSYRDMNDGDTWNLNWTVSASSFVNIFNQELFQIVLMEYDSENDRDYVGTITIPKAYPAGSYTETIEGDGGKYRISYIIER